MLVSLFVFVNFFDTMRADVSQESSLKQLACHRQLYDGLSRHNSPITPAAPVKPSRPNKEFD